MKNQLVVWAWVLLFLMGCKATKDNHAFTRVISHPDLAERTYRALAVTHPCITDFTIGKDSIILVDTIKDITEINNANKLIDSLLDKLLNPADTNYVDIDSVRAELYNEIRKTVKPRIVKVTTTRTDTIRDVRLVNQLTSDNSVLQGQSIELNKQVATLKKANTHKTFYLIGAGLLLLISIFIYIKKK